MLDIIKYNVFGVTMHENSLNGRIHAIITPIFSLLHRCCEWVYEYQTSSAFFHNNEHVYKILFVISAVVAPTTTVVQMHGVLVFREYCILWLHNLIITYIKRAFLILHIQGIFV